MDLTRLAEAGYRAIKEAVANGYTGQKGQGNGTERSDSGAELRCDNNRGCGAPVLGR